MCMCVWGWGGREGERGHGAVCAGKLKGPKIVRGLRIISELP